jgi:Pyridoxamine 5'-phosphate oxidase
MEAKNLAELYELPLVDWQRVEARLTGGAERLAGTGGPDNRSWLATTNPDGSPHLTGLGPQYVSGLFYFTTGETTRKARNLAKDPRCTLGVSTDEFDLAVDGNAAQVDDPDVVADLAGRWAAGGWPARVDPTGLALTADYSAPSAGPPPWRVYRLTPRQATVVLATAPGGATRWRF